MYLITLSCFVIACGDELTETSSQQVAEAESSECAQAVAHVEACVGRPIESLGETCDPLDAELLLETSCEVLVAASEVEIDEKSDVEISIVRTQEMKCTSLTDDSWPGQSGTKVPS